jgi:hypothetical protein
MEARTHVTLSQLTRAFTDWFENGETWAELQNQDMPQGERDARFLFYLLAQQDRQPK